MTIDRTSEEQFDDILMAMDVVDTLRQNKQVVERELKIAHYDEDLIEKLRNVYAAQGIDVPDHILQKGVDALREDRFVYTPMPPSFSRSLAEKYVRYQKIFPWFLLISLCFLGLLMFILVYAFFNMLTGA